MRIASILILLVVLYGCDSMIFEPDPANTPENNFEIFWKDFDRYYAQFTVRHIDWDSVYALYRPQISPSTSDRQLFDYILKHSPRYQRYACKSVYPDGRCILEKYDSCCLSQHENY